LAERSLSREIMEFEEWLAPRAESIREIAEVCSTNPKFGQQRNVGLGIAPLVLDLDNPNPKYLSLPPCLVPIYYSLN
jgi:hypothetical protein